MKRAYIYIRHLTQPKSDTAIPTGRVAKPNIADFLLDATNRNSTIVGAANGAGLLAECREDFSNKIP